MAISRSYIADHLHSQYEILAKEARQTIFDDSANGYGPDIDQALRQMGIPVADLGTAEVAEDQEGEVLALARFFALRRFAARLATRIDPGGGFAVQEGRRDIFRNVKDLLEMAREEAQGYGHLLSGESAWELARLNLDFIEPLPTGLANDSLYLE